ncbi:MAG: hypothetical protein AAF568_01175 [Pseudomonadota bacterium]
MAIETTPTDIQDAELDHVTGAGEARERASGDDTVGGLVSKAAGGTAVKGGLNDKDVFLGGTDAADD